MNGNQVGGILCLAFAAMLGVAGAASLNRGDGPAVDDASGLGVSRAVGAFLPSLSMAIVGAWLLQKKAPDEPEPRRRTPRRARAEPVSPDPPEDQPK